MALSANLIAAIADKQHRPIIKLEIDWDGDGVFDDETGYVLDAVGIESFDPDTGALQPGECNLTLDNLNQRFSAENENSPIYAYLQGAFLTTKASARSSRGGVVAAFRSPADRKWLRGNGASRDKFRRFYPSISRIKDYQGATYPAGDVSIY